MPEPITTSTATPTLRTHRFRAMACDVTVQLVGVGTDEAAAAFNRVEDLFGEVESACTRFDPRSPLMVANAAPRRWHQVPDSCSEAIREAHEAYRISGGLFDPRVLRCLQVNGYDRSLPFSDGDVLNKPWHAHSFPVIAFTVGSILPIVAIQLPPAGSPGTSHTCRGTARPHRCNEREPGRRALGPAVARIVIADALAIAVTHGIGQLVGAAGI